MRRISEHLDMFYEAYEVHNIFLVVFALVVIFYLAAMGILEYK